MDRAIRFIYLNRTCFNGIYRVNHKGEFNVPMGSKILVKYPDGCLCSIAAHLSTVSLKVADFEDTLDGTGQGDFVFVDPPYTVMRNNNNFNKYNASLFSWTDQVRLSSAIKRAAARGAEIMLSNADHHCILTLYYDFGHHHRITRSSVLAAESGHRCMTSELLITTYKPQNGEGDRELALAVRTRIRTARSPHLNYRSSGQQTYLHPRISLQYRAATK
jgi:DNA adenine methylase